LHRVLVRRFRAVHLLPVRSPHPRNSDLWRLLPDGFFAVGSITGRTWIFEGSVVASGMFSGVGIL